MSADAHAAPKTWFITGASKGLGRQWAAAALARGDKVAAAARSVDLLDELTAAHGDAVLPIALDVGDRAAAFAAVARAHDHFGRLDVVVNNAGYGHNGAVEEVTEAEVRTQMDTNFFGMLWVTQAALPLLREQGGGRILQVSSIAGQIGISQLGVYCASKWALEGLSESLAQEVRPFGIRVTIVEPGGYRTAAHVTSPRSAPHPAYERGRQRQAELAGGAGDRYGDPAATSAAILQVVDADDPPLRLILGEGLLPMINARYESRLATWQSWADVSVAAQGGLTA